jgi:hypothetical protein
MAHTFCSLHVHCAFSAKNLQPLLVGEIKERFGRSWVVFSKETRYRHFETPVPLFKSLGGRWLGAASREGNFA